ncbi:hypothetical protein CRG98_042860 [Punica granatum]|uniref:Retrotransposon gag domain-containing protein n=1 Tax=Punica granatum TaxID=22663 RepID=A0A2I0HYK0_PUNGR|nr:hypothetical protein CRG98_042860 [Punica granatum]
MPTLIKIPPGPVATLSLEEVQRLTEEKAAKAIQATEWKQLSLPSPNENLESPLLLDILNTKIQSTMCADITSLLGRGAFENFQCLLFPVTLIGIAFDWFHSLAPSSITSFKQLQELFI